MVLAFKLRLHVQPAKLLMKFEEFRVYGTLAKQSYSPIQSFTIQAQEVQTVVNFALLIQDVHASTANVQP